MRQARITQHIFLFVIVLTLLQVEAAFAQTNRIPPIHIDEWFANRVWYIAAAGALAGGLWAGFWLPRLFSSVPHQDDNRRARKRFYFAWASVVVAIAAYLLIDAALIYRFGRQTFTFWESFLQVWLTWQTFVMLLLSAIMFFLIVALWTRYVSNKPYRYMLISR
jgi:hypothetical protein